MECGAIQDIPKATPAKDAWKKYGKGKESVVVFPESVPFTCNKGYSLTGVHGGEINFETECKSDGSFSKNQYFDKMCLPVTCGIPELVKHSIWLQPERFYLETVTYACLNGYTLTGEPTAESIYTMTCEHEGRFDVPYPECMPVVCGDAPDFNPNNPSDRTPEVKGEVTYESPPVDYVCARGYSIMKLDDPYDPLAANFSVTCDATGQFSPGPDASTSTAASSTAAATTGFAQTSRNPRACPSTTTRAIARTATRSLCTRAAPERASWRRFARTSRLPWPP